MRKRERAVRLHPSEEPTVVLRSPVVQEALPSPWVHYPNHYGTFMAFGEDDHEFPALCNCATGAVANYLALRKLVDMGTYADERITAPLSSHTFPNRLAEESLRRKADPMAWLRFEPRLCHRCNLATPTLRWCLEMYGSRFKQFFGWYIQQSAYRLGVSRPNHVYLHNACPDELIQRVKATRLAADKAEAERLRLIPNPPREGVWLAS